MSLEEHIKNAKPTDEILIKFIKVTDKTERTVKFCVDAGVGFKFKNNIKLGPKMLKTITKNHDRVYTQSQTIVGSLFTFPEEITEHTTHVTNVETSPSGKKWQWRKLYVEQVLEVTSNGVKWFENSDPLAWKILGDTKQVTSIKTKAEIDKREEELKQNALKNARNKAEYRLFHKKAVEAAKSLTADDCKVSLGWVNGWGYDTSNPKDIERGAIVEKHRQLEREFPNEHRTVDVSPYDRSIRGDSTYECKCGFTFKVDSSD